MPELVTPEAVTANNTKVAASLEREQSLAPAVDPLSVGALDELAAQKSKENEEAAKKGAVPAAPAVTPAAGAEAPDEAAKKAAEEAAAAAAKEKTEREEALKKANELFQDAPQLAPNASPKSAEAFSAIKIRAAQEISKLQADLEAKAKELKELSAKAGAPSPEQLAKEKELEDLRAWRAKMDVDFDPKFKTFDASIAKSHEFIYAQLRKSPAVTEDTIEQIKKYGGPDKCNLTELFKAINDDNLTNTVKSEITGVMKQRFEKDQAVKSAKENLNGYLADRAKNFQESTTAHQQATATELGTFTNSLEWFKEKSAAEKATAAEKAEIEEHNKFVADLKQQMVDTLRDDSPRMRATLITGVMQLFNLQRVHKAQTAVFEALKKDHAALQAKWDRVKDSSRSRLEESNAPTGPQAAKKVDIANLRTQDALDVIGKQIMEEKARASGGGQ